MKYTASIILDSLTPSGGSLLALIISAVLNSAICLLLTRSEHPSPPYISTGRLPILRSVLRSAGSVPDLVRDHMQTILALVVPDHIAQVGHARHDLRRHAPGPAEQPAPAQRHKAPVQRRGKEFIDKPECMAPLIEPYIR